jgi:S1-C subfamily serine protease
VPLCVEDPPVREPFPVYIYTHTETWIEASATIVREEVASLWLDVPGAIEGGTSGSPVVTEQGEVIGIVSLFGSEQDGTHCVGPQPRPARALPVWVLEQILAAQASEEA